MKKCDKGWRGSCLKSSSTGMIISFNNRKRKRKIHIKSGSSGLLRWVCMRNLPFVCALPAADDRHLSSCVEGPDLPL